MCGDAEGRLFMINEVTPHMSSSTDLKGRRIRSNRKRAKMCWMTELLLSTITRSWFQVRGQVSHEIWASARYRAFRRIFTVLGMGRIVGRSVCADI